jgi:hypothetical protein
MNAACSLKYWQTSTRLHDSTAQNTATFDLTDTRRIMVTELLGSGDGASDFVIMVMNLRIPFHTISWTVCLSVCQMICAMNSVFLHSSLFVSLAPGGYEASTQCSLLKWRHAALRTFHRFVLLRCPCRSLSTLMSHFYHHPQVRPSPLSMSFLVYTDVSLLPPSSTHSLVNDNSQTGTCGISRY